MLKFNILLFVVVLVVNSCKTEEKVKIVKHKNQNPTLENSDFLYNTESEEELKKQYKRNYDKRQELEQYQPSRNNNTQEFQRTKKKKVPKAPVTHY